MHVRKQRDDGDVLIDRIDGAELVICRAGRNVEA